MKRRRESVTAKTGNDAPVGLTAGSTLLRCGLVLVLAFVLVLVGNLELGVAASRLQNEAADIATQFLGLAVDTVVLEDAPTGEGASAIAEKRQELTDQVLPRLMAEWSRIRLLGLGLGLMLLALPLCAALAHRERLAMIVGWKRPSGGLATVGLVLMGTPFVLSLDLSSALLLFGELPAVSTSPPPSPEDISVPFWWLPSDVAGLVLLTPLAEETIFRGYMQRQLLRHWRGPLVIAITSSAFTVLHMDVHHMAGVWIGSIWFGYVAWRTDSLWPSTIAHACNNGVIVLLGMLVEPTAQLSTWILVVLLALVSAAPFAMAVRRIEAHASHSTETGPM